MAIWCGWAALYDIYCQNPLHAHTPPTAGEMCRTSVVTAGVCASIAAAILLTIAVNR